MPVNANKVRESLEKINLPGDLRFNEPMSAHTTFKVGGPADIWFRPASRESLVRVLLFAHENQLPFTMLGGGANVVISDRGVRGFVIDSSGLRNCNFDENALEVDAGLPVSDAAAFAADRGLAGLDFIYAMPGSVGGAVWMNARCYDGEISNILKRVDYLDTSRTLKQLVPAPGDFAYKKSPFQGKPWIILGARFELTPADSKVLWTRMHALEADRRSKGHFDAPCAGSVFKNDHRFGEPSGKIIDRLGLRGTQLGGAKISLQHANIIINTGNASASDIRNLVTLVHDKVKTSSGFDLEAEVVFLGDWTLA